MARLQVILSATLATTLICLAVFWYWLSDSAWGGAMPFYVWVKLYAVLLPSQFWLFAEEVLDPRQARRLFAPIGAGGILGGIVGSGVATVLADHGLEARLLLIIAAVAVAAAAGSGWLQRKSRETEPDGAAHGRGGRGCWRRCRSRHRADVRRGRCLGIRHLPRHAALRSAFGSLTRRGSRTGLGALPGAASPAPPLTTLRRRLSDTQAAR